MGKPSLTHRPKKKTVHFPTMGGKAQIQALSPEELAWVHRPGGSVHTALRKHHAGLLTPAESEALFLTLETLYDVSGVRPSP